jgi:hypothetical protein
MSFQVADIVFVTCSDTPLKDLREVYGNVAKCCAQHCTSSDENRRSAVKSIRAAPLETDINAIVRRMIRAVYLLSSFDSNFIVKQKMFHSLLDKKRIKLVKEQVELVELAELVKRRPIPNVDGVLCCAQCDAVTSDRMRCENCHSPQGLKKCGGCSSVCVVDTDRFCFKCGASQM